MKTYYTPITFKVPPFLKRWVKAQAKQRKETPSAWLHRLVKEKHEVATNGSATS